MRLIDADKLIGVLKSDSDSVLEKALLGIVEGQPTAYDVDKVVEQLQTESDRWKESGTEYKDEKELGIAEGYGRAIEIVKAGGR